MRFCLGQEWWQQHHLERRGDEAAQLAVQMGTSLEQAQVFIEHARQRLGEDEDGE